MTHDEISQLEIKTIALTNITFLIPENVLHSKITNCEDLESVMLLINNIVENYTVLEKMINAYPGFINCLINTTKKINIITMLHFLTRYYDKTLLKLETLNYAEIFNNVDFSELTRIIVTNKDTVDIKVVLQITKAIPELETLIMSENLELFKRKQIKQLELVSKKRKLEDIYDDNKCKDSSIICSICDENEKNIVYANCGHTLCNACKDKIGHTCPFCRRQSNSHKVIL
jgi:hypothetical protein